MQSRNSTPITTRIELPAPFSIGSSYVQPRQPPHAPALGINSTSVEAPPKEGRKEKTVTKEQMAALDRGIKEWRNRIESIIQAFDQQECKSEFSRGEGIPPGQLRAFLNKVQTKYHPTSFKLNPQAAPFESLNERDRSRFTMKDLVDIRERHKMDTVDNPLPQEMAHLWVGTEGVDQILDELCSRLQDNGWCKLKKSIAVTLPPSPARRRESMEGVKIPITGFVVPQTLTMSFLPDTKPAMP